jgi:hypothetical protein
MSEFIASEMRSIGSLVANEVGAGGNPTTTAVFDAAGEQAVIAANSSWVVVMFQAHLISGGTGNSATAQLLNLVSGVVYATLVLTQAGSFAIENQGREFGPLISSTNGSITLTARVISASDTDDVAVLANVEQAYINPVV